MHTVMSPIRSAKRPSTTVSSCRLHLHRSGRFDSADGGSCDLEPKDALLLAYLALEGPTPRAKLAALLWPDVEEERARGNLRQRLLRLKRTTGVELVTGGTEAQLAGAVGHDLDHTHELLQAIEPEQAAGLADWLEAQGSAGVGYEPKRSPLPPRKHSTWAISLERWRTRMLSSN